jgi:hypothetical protein
MTRRDLILLRTLWVLAAVALAALWRPEALVLLIPLAVLGPVLREASPARDQDERERLEDYRASHIAFAVTYGLLFLLFARSWLQLGHEPPNEMWLLVVAPLLVRITLAVGRGAGARRLALLLGFVCGAAWTAFSTLSHGLSLESSVGGSLLVFTTLGIRWPRLGGSLLTLSGIAFLVFFILLPLGRQDWIGSLLMTLALPLPPLLAGIGLLGWSFRHQRVPSDEFGDLRART